MKIYKISYSILVDLDDEEKEKLRGSGYTVEENAQRIIDSEFYIGAYNFYDALEISRDELAEMFEECNAADIKSISELEDVYIENWPESEKEKEGG